MYDRVAEIREDWGQWMAEGYEWEDLARWCLDVVPELLDEIDRLRGEVAADA